MRFDSEALSKRVEDLEAVESSKQVSVSLEQELKSKVSELEEQLVDKNKVMLTTIHCN